MEPIELCARFSYVTNKLEYCGPKSCTQIIFSFLNGDESLKEEVYSGLLKFEGLMPYFSEMGGFTQEAVEAYWLGNSLLDDFPKEKMVKIIENLVERGLPQFIGDKVIEKMPQGSFPHHSFNVIFVGVGMLTGSVATTTENMDKCRISSGKVIEVGKKLKVVSDKLIMEDEKMKLIPIKKEVDFNFIKPKLGDVVAIHWNRAIMILNKEQEDNLRKYTGKVIDLVN